jgi:hypothetical protein
LPAGDYFFEMERGPEYHIRTGRFTIQPRSQDHQLIEMVRFADLAKEGWYSGDLHVARSARDMPLLMEAEDLYLAPVITWTGTVDRQSEQSSPADVPRPQGQLRLYHLLAGKEEGPGGRLLLFGLRQPPPPVQVRQPYPSGVELARLARQQPDSQLVAGHPFSWDLPVWAAGGYLDSVAVLCDQLRRQGDRDADEVGGKTRDVRKYPSEEGVGRWAQDIYYHLLNCGLRIPPSAGSGSGDGPNPLGYNRVYVFCGQEFSYDSWWRNLREGKVFVTNGPLLRPRVNGQLPGHVFHAQAGQEGHARHRAFAGNPRKD